jgi:hypothetical protein
MIRATSRIWGLGRRRAGQRGDRAVGATGNGGADQVRGQPPADHNPFLRFGNVVGDQSVSFAMHGIRGLR